MASSAMLKPFCVCLLGLLVLAPHAEAGIGCGQVYSSLNPCLGYIAGRALDPRCCPNIKGLLGSVRTKSDRQAVCGCLKNLANSYSSSLGKARELLGRCGVSLPYPLDPRIDCSRVN